MNDYEDDDFEAEESVGHSNSRRALPKVEKKSSGLALPPVNMRISHLDEDKGRSDKIKGGQSSIKLPQKLSKSNLKENRDSFDAGIKKAGKKRFDSKSRSKLGNSISQHDTLLNQNNPSISRVGTSKGHEKLVLKVQTHS